MSSKTRFPGLEGKPKTNPFEGKNIDAIEEIAGKAPVVIPPEPKSAPEPVAETLQTTTRDDAVTAVRVRKSRKSSEEKVVIPSQRLRKDVVEAMNYIARLEDRSLASVINNYMGPTIIELAKQKGWSEN